MIMKLHKGRTTGWLDNSYKVQRTLKGASYEKGTKSVAGIPIQEGPPGSGRMVTLEQPGGKLQAVRPSQRNRLEAKGKQLSVIMTILSRIVIINNNNNL